MTVKSVREALKFLAPVAKAEGVALGNVSFQGRHPRLTCERRDGTTFFLIVPFSASDRRFMENLARDLRKHARSS